MKGKRAREKGQCARAFAALGEIVEGQMEVGTNQTNGLGLGSLLGFARGQKRGTRMWH
jgi:hypothetical protein